MPRLPPELSPELHREVVEYLKNGDIETLRFCGNHAMTAIAVLMIFLNICIPAMRVVLTTFAALTTHPILQEYVRGHCQEHVSRSPVAKYQYDEYGQQLARPFKSSEVFKRRRYTRAERRFKMYDPCLEGSRGHVSRLLPSW